MQSFQRHSAQDIEKALLNATEAFNSWKKTPFSQKTKLMKNAATHLRQNRLRLAQIITEEMGKPIVESEGEVEKCSWNCDYYAINAERFLRDEPRSSNASESYVQYTPLGNILAVMPWNFPFWQVFRFAVPALMAGNTGFLKHASNVPRCALAIEEVFREAGFPAGTFQTLLIPSSAVGALVENPAIAAVTLTGSEEAGSRVASAAGRSFKKTVLELGGSDPFIVLEDANLEAAVRIGVKARYQNAGQSCIAAKRFIIVESVFREYQDHFVEAVRELRIGDPMDRATQVGPMARYDLIADLERQVRASTEQGARVLIGGKRCTGRGYFFEPTVLTDVLPGMPAGCEEVFGPVAALIRARDAEEAVQIANQTAYGLGSSLWTADIARAKKMARQIEAGQVFINGMVSSDPRLPFGGVKRSGYGRELSEYGIREFVNIQTIWIGPPK
jgi:acyl-CoA reductase-like NAD-dependent aldehyde dehydrogenase